MNPSEQGSGLEHHLRTLIINHQTRPPVNSSAREAGPRHSATPTAPMHSRGLDHSRSRSIPTDHQNPASFQSLSDVRTRGFPGEIPSAVPHDRLRMPHHPGPSQNPHHWPGYGQQRKAPPLPVVPLGPPPAAGSLHHFPPLGAKIAPPPPPPPAQQQSALPSVSVQHQPHSRRPENQRPSYQRGDRDLYQQPQHRSAGVYDSQLAEQVRALYALANAILPIARPLPGETAAKEQLLRDLEACCQQVDPNARLIPFGSIVTGFATRGSDIDCVFTSNPESVLQNSEITETESPFRVHESLVRTLKESGYDAQLLTKTRVPIIKLVRPPTVDVPESVSCDIGFNNFLAIHNTQLLKTYAGCDGRLIQMVLFIKWWAKRRHINSPYRGTLSSYGYALLIVHYLINIVKPPVLPNLQLFPAPVMRASEAEFQFKHNGNMCNIWYFKDIHTLPKSVNQASLGELLRGFFEYYAFNYNWQHNVVSVRTPGGILTKQSKNWCAARTRPRGEEEGHVWEVKDRYLLAIEDPFEITHNVARTCTFNGVGRIKVELKRAMYMIRARDGGQRLRDELFTEAPPERPFVKHDDKPSKNQQLTAAEDKLSDHDTETAEDHDHFPKETAIVADGITNTALETTVGVSAIRQGAETPPVLEDSTISPGNSSSSNPGCQVPVSTAVHPPHIRGNGRIHQV